MTRQYVLNHTGRFPYSIRHRFENMLPYESLFYSKNFRSQLQLSHTFATILDMPDLLFCHFGKIFRAYGDREFRAGFANP